jgi:hypothetical protein
MAELSISDNKRRENTRFLFKCSVQIASKDNQNIEGELVNISGNGALVYAKAPVSQDGAIEMSFLLNGKDIKLSGIVVWVSSNIEFGGYSVGVRLDNLLEAREVVEKIISLEGKSPAVVERRKKVSESKFPLKRRQDDYLREYYKSPYHTCLESLKKFSKKEKIRLIVLDQSLAHLAKKVRKIFPEPRLITIDNIDSYIPKGTLIILNLNTRRRHEAFTFLDFEEYFLKKNSSKDTLNSLVEISRSLTENSEVYISCFGSIQNIEIMKKYLTVAKFKDIEILDDHLVKAKKRELFSRYINNDTYLIQEIQSRLDIDEVQNFSGKFYSKEFNFCKDIDDLFTNHSDFYRVVNPKTGKIITAARVTWHLPNHFLPCMLAHKKGTDLHMLLSSPDQISYGEIYAPYLNAVTATKIYGEMVKIFYSYVDKKLMDVILTTYQSEKSRELHFLSRYLGFKETGTTLTYGDFGGAWGLVYSYKDNFDENIKIRFISPNSRVPKIITDILG